MRRRTQGLWPGLDGCTQPQGEELPDLALLSPLTILLVILVAKPNRESEGRGPCGCREVGLHDAGRVRTELEGRTDSIQERVSLRKWCLLCFTAFPQHFLGLTDKKDNFFYIETMR